ncbi:hypothetical protein EVA_06128 [gut metagenome]|uniref:Uncharacterized protein n=1 Tax=gut metagenome TaxID=749906 RepID=J9GY78_9ZZZZ
MPAVVAALGWDSRVRPSLTFKTHHNHENRTNFSCP